VFFTKTRATKSSSADVSARARAAGQAAQVAAQNAQVAAQNAAQNAAAAARTAAVAAQATAQTAASGVSSGVQQGVYSARRWTAPRLELAAEHVTKTVAPSVSTALRSTARQVKPAEPAKRTHSALTWSLLGAAIVATAGAAFALIRYQFRAATSDETVEVGETTDVSGTPTAAKPAGPVIPGAPSGTSGASGASGTSGTSSPSAASTSATNTTAGKTAASKTADDKTATTTDTSVNGHVASRGW
jgi:hypothetical protein